MALASDKVKQKPSNYYNKKDTVIKYDAFCLINFVSFKLKCYYYCFFDVSSASSACGSARCSAFKGNTCA